MWIAVLLSVVAGLLMGFLGGGGSLLLLPILVYAAGLTEQNAVEVSLLVVALTSIVALVQHARRRSVRWKTGLLFGLVGAASAYLGGLFSPLFPSWLLMLLFSLLVVAAGISMLKEKAPSSTPKEASLGRVVLLAALLGLVTGLLGAGGGFLIVPVLIRYSAIPIHQAIGTSLFIITLNATAGFVSHFDAASFDYAVALYTALAAGAGALLGASMSHQVRPERLRRGFAWFLFAVAAFLLFKQLPSLYEAVFVSRWPAALGGLAIGGFVLLFLYRKNQALGVSTGYLDACEAVTSPKARTSWRLPFIIGIVAGGLVSALFAGSFAPHFAAGIYEAVASSLTAKALLFTAGGVLLGYGARVAGGCTSGHSIVGVAQLAPSSLIATAAFMASGFVVTNLLLRAFGGVV